MTDLSLTRFLVDDDCDVDPAETNEWRQALESLVATQGPARARFILDEIAALARSPRIAWSHAPANRRQAGAAREWGWSGRRNAA